MVSTLVDLGVIEVSGGWGHNKQINQETSNQCSSIPFRSLLR